MNTEAFYGVLDKELSEIVGKHADDAYISKNKSVPDKQKAFALLIWFLDFYGKKSDYSDYITDGDDDGSCDLIFDNMDNQGRNVFYIVQSKWNILGNCGKEVEKKEILQALADFDAIIKGKKERVNAKLKAKLVELNTHLSQNGDVKFIYLALCRENPKADDNIRNFVNSHRRTRFEFYDINRIKVDYIERHYKKIDPTNPLENHYDPEESKINIEIKRLGTSENCIRIERPFEAYVFLIRPKTVFELFEKFGFSLFFRNVRNPLIKSDFNKEIEDTAIDNPAYFWYYNNGLTAITYMIPEIRGEATLLELTGLQIINGAQTVYSVYKAYKEASPTKREIMNSEAFITLRLLKSGGRDFDLKVTKFTNSQNPISDRDFKANDDVQVMLQNQFYATPFWYEKRRGEFRSIPKGVRIVPNDVFANCYLAYWLGDPVSVVMNLLQMEQSKKDLLFVSHKDDKGGLYEKVFGPDARFEDFLTSYCLMEIIVNNSTSEDPFSVNLYQILSLSKVVLEKYLKAKWGADTNVELSVRRMLEKGDTSAILKALKYIDQYLLSIVQPNGDVQSSSSQYSISSAQIQFERVKGELERREIGVQTIDDIELNAENV